MPPSISTLGESRQNDFECTLSIKKKKKKNFVLKKKCVLAEKLQGWDKEFPFTFQLDVPNGNILVIFNFYLDKICTPDFPGGSVVKNPPANAGDARDMGLITGSERSPGEGDGNPLQYSCLENPMAHGQRSLGGYSLWSCKESDTTEVTKWQHNSRTMKCTL